MAYNVVRTLHEEVLWFKQKRDEAIIVEIKAAEVVKQLTEAGFVEKKSSGHQHGGDHHFFRNPDGRTTTVPYTRLKDSIAVGTYKAILRQAKLNNNK